MLTRRGDKYFRDLPYSNKDYFLLQDKYGCLIFVVMGRAHNVKSFHKGHSLDHQWVK